MKEVNNTIKSTSTTKIVSKASGKDISNMSKNIKKLAVNTKEGKLTVKDCSDAAKSVEEIIEPSNSDGGNNSKKSKKTTYIIVGCVIGGVVLVAVIVGLFLFFRRKPSENSVKEQLLI